MELRVESYAGYKAEEAPRSFWLDERKVAVVEIIAQWRTPDFMFFKVTGDDGEVYVLKTDGASWSFG